MTDIKLSQKTNDIMENYMICSDNASYKARDIIKKQSIFHISIVDKVYDGPLLDKWDIPIEKYTLEFYTSIDKFKDKNTSPIHIFPENVFNKFKENVKKFYKTYPIHHNITIVKVNNCFDVSYEICNFALFDRGIQKPHVFVHMYMNEDELINILSKIFHYFPEVIINH